jgi:hypothetical protein
MKKPKRKKINSKNKEIKKSPVFNGGALTCFEFIRVTTDDYCWRESVTITFTLSEASSDFTKDDVSVLGGVLSDIINGF